MSYGFKQLEGITADAGIEAWGDTLSEAFRGAGEGLASLLADIPESDLQTPVPVMVQGENLPSLLVNFLNELIFLEEAKGLIPGKIRKIWMKGMNLFATVNCAPADGVDPSIRSQVKAATYHDLRIDQSEKEVRIRVIFDV